MIPLPKLKAILVYFANNTEKLGKVKLMKLIYFLDFVHVKKYGRPVTFDNYVNIEHGPIPSTIKSLVDYLGEDINSKLADAVYIKKVPTRKKAMDKIVPRREFNKNDERLFSKSELEVLKEVAKRFKNANSDQIEKASHQESPWKSTNYLDPIDYSLASNDKDSKFSKEEIELLLKTT